MPKLIIGDYENLKTPKNVKSINNTTVSHLVSCPRPAVQYQGQPRWRGEKKMCCEKYVLLEI